MIEIKFLKQWEEERGRKEGENRVEIENEYTHELKGSILKVINSFQIDL